MKLILIGLISVLLFYSPNLCGQITIDNLMDPPFPTGLVSSPDGKRIAWVFNEKGVRNIYGAEAPEFAPRNLTQQTSEDGQEISSLVFATNDLMIFVKGGAANRQGETPNPLTLQENIEQGIWSLKWSSELKKVAKGSYPCVSPDGTKFLYLSGGQVWLVPSDGSAEGKKMFQARGTQESTRWSPDGNQIAFISDRIDHSFVGIYDIKSSALKFLDPSFDHDSNPVWSADGKKLAYIRTPHVKESLPFFSQREGYPWSIRTAEISSGTSIEVWRAQPGKGSVLFQDVPNVDNLLFWMNNTIIFPWERTGWIHLYALNVNGGPVRDLTPGEGEIEHATLSHDQKSLLAVTNISDIDRRHIWRVHPDGKFEQLTRGQGIEWSEAETTMGVACLRSDAVTVAWPYLITSGGKLKMLSEELFPKSFPKDLLVVPEAIQLTAKDGLKAPGQLFVPKNHKAGDKHPAVIFVHGGSRRQMLLGFNYGGYYHNAYAMNQYLTSRGYIVLSLNYRSGIGYGLEFREALNYGADGASEYNDVIGAGNYLLQRQDVDSKRIAMWGGSYGGYLTALGLARNSDMFACGVDIHGVHDWNSGIKNFVPSYDPQRLGDVSKKAFESSPLNFVKGWKSPVLLIHGDDDRNVSFNETVTLVEELRKQQVYFEQLIFPDEIHMFLLYQSWVKAYKASAAFLEQEFKKIK